MPLVSKSMVRYWRSYTKLNSQYIDGIQRLTTLKAFNADKQKSTELAGNAKGFYVEAIRNTSLPLIDSGLMMILTSVASTLTVAIPKGYDTVTGERGVQLSGGQRQRIAIARAVLKNSPILVLDEAVSSLDTENERFIQSALKEQFSGSTTLVVAHRLSTIMAVDRLVVLNHGRVAQVGSHSKLIAQEGLYKELVSSQFSRES